MRTFGKADGRIKKKEASGDGSSSEISYEELLAYAVCVMGISKSDFEWMTPSEFIECAKTWRETRERDIQLQYEITRFNSWLNLAPYIDLNRKSQEDIFPFPWEKKKTAKVTNAKTNSISKIKSAIRRGEQEAKG